MTEGFPETAPAWRAGKPSVIKRETGNLSNFVIEKRLISCYY